MIRPGELWLANIPFTDGSSAKRRPVLVLWLDGQDVVVAAVTSALPRTATDVALKNWRESGLRVASTVRLSRLDCLEQSLLQRRLGLLQPTNATAIRDAWVRLVRPGF
jgi:mRNA interferase MazF